MASSIWFPGLQIVDTQLRENLARTDNEEFGAGLIGFAAELPYLEGTVGKTLNDLLTGFAAVQEIVQEGYANIENFGAVGDDVTDCLPAITAALAASDRIYIPVPEVAYRISGPISITRSGIKILGENKLLSKLRITTASGHVISCAAGTNNLEFNNFCVDRASPAVAGGSGIYFTGYTQDTKLIDMVAVNQYNGFYVRGGWQSLMQRCLAFDNYHHGFRLQADGSGQVAWELEKCFSAYNDAAGYYLDAVGAGIASTLAGEFQGCYALYNKEYGLRAEGEAAAKLQSVRILGGAYSFNGTDNLHLNTYSGRHRIVSISCTGAGIVATGRRAAPTAASLAGNGIRITANNDDAVVLGTVCQDNNYSGIHDSAAISVLSSNVCLSNGRNTGATNAVRSGIRLEGGRHSVSANLCSNVTGVTTQQLGISATSLTAGSRISHDNLLQGNTVDDILVDAADPFALAAVTVGASPWTYTANGVMPEVVYIRGGTFSALTQGGQTLATAAGTVVPVYLNPGESFTLTYSVSPTVIKKQLS